MDSEEATHRAPEAPPLKGDAEEKEPEEKWAEVCVAKEGEKQSSREFQEVPVAAEFN